MQDDLSRTFSALADPTRRAMLARLAAGEANVSELAEPFLKTMSLPAVTKHLKVLENAGLINKGRNAQWRPCRLNGEPLREAVDWMEHYRVAWEEQLNRLGAFLRPRLKEFAMATTTKSNVLSLTRVYDAPLLAVWEAWTIPEEVAQWWGPRGFSLTTHARDFRTGGHWHYTMHGPDGTDYENTTQYLEVVPMQRLVYDHGGHQDRPPLFRVHALFTERDGRTQLDLSMAFATPEIAETTKGFIKKAGGEGTWDRLAEHVAKRHANKDYFFITRSFDANIEQVYAMWADPAHLKHWLPPTGATMEFLRTAVEVDASSFYAMTLPGDTRVYGLIRYLVLDQPNRLVYAQQFCDVNEQVLRPPFFEHWPLTMVSTIELTAESPTRTRVRVRWEPADANAADLAEFIKQRGSMTMGWTGSFDKLEALFG